MYVQRQLGHSDIATTERYYGHLERHVLAAGAIATEEAIARAVARRRRDLRSEQRLLLLGGACAGAAARLGLFRPVEFPRFCGVLSTCGESAAGRMDWNAEVETAVSGAVPA